jgi:hypothetical protein
VGLAFLGLHWALMHAMMTMPHQGGNPPPQQVFGSVLKVQQKDGLW